MTTRPGAASLVRGLASPMLTLRRIPHVRRAGGVAPAVEIAQLKTGRHQHSFSRASAPPPHLHRTRLQLSRPSKVNSFSVTHRRPFSSASTQGFWFDKKMSDPKELRKYLQQSHDKIFESNRKWAQEQKEKNPEFFEKLSQGQEPDYLWIGRCFLVVTHLLPYLLLCVFILSFLPVARGTCQPPTCCNMK
jgi:hypothetical protein